MYIKNLTREVINYSVPYGARSNKKKVSYRSSNYDKFNNLLKTTTGIKSKFFNISIFATMYIHFICWQMI